MKFVPCWNMDIVGISLLYHVYFNASIYLVKGGRLSLMPGVFFHSCRSSFHHTGVMFLDFAFLTRLGVMGTPWKFALNKTPPARTNLGFTICLPTTIYLSLGFCRLKGHLYFKPPGQCSSECWSKKEPLAAPPRGNLRVGFTRRMSHPVCLENEICAAPIGICRHSRVVLLVLFYHCRNVL